ncbi:TrmH family RNA methyltransferase [Leptolyngbya iicbica]|uniref:RNA methyltransferase n=2 Tax=Cyanophyceae TaxID=3028117 RepID=A0A4Q7E5R0_9CYAN|nr:RNA methyltransferase [Leptolyngbya sp. LK]RZM77195.1 RNA methyltransferase [Leptolyngbya sp. LK]
MLTSLKNPWIKTLRKLHLAKYRRQQQQFLLEGTHLVQVAIATQYPLQAACATEAWQVRHPALWQQLSQCTARQETVSPEVLGAIATTETPDGVVAIAPSDTITTTVDAPTLGLALEDIQDPGNVGTLMRTAAAAGSDGIWLSQNSVDLTHPKVLRASAGQWFRLPKQVGDNLLAQMSTWRDQGCQILATAATGAVPYWQLDLTHPMVLVVGNEGAGLSASAIAAADHTVAIPMMNDVESLNVGVAAAVILFEALRQRQAAG